MTGDINPSSTHPPLPPTTEDTRFHHLRLLRSRRVGVATYHRLLIEHGTAQKALAALPEVARAAGLSKYEICPEGVIEAELRAGRKLGATLLVHGHEGYPQTLSDMADAPPILWALGRLDVLNKPLVSLVGARNASALGTRMARALAAELAEAGFVIVSGLARGIDAAAHDASLATGTIAVQAGGVDILYPAENAALAAKITKSGLRVSEHPFGLQPQARHFPARNRIIAGLGQATVVIEAAAKSGSLITARDALDLGREVLAVPGHPFDARAAGCNMLIRDGATLVRRAEDVREALGPLAAAGLHKLSQGELPLGGTAAIAQTQVDAAANPAPQNRADLAALHRDVLTRLGPSPVAVDQLLRDIGASNSVLAPVLTELELDGKITRQPGGLISLSA